VPSEAHRQGAVLIFADPSDYNASAVQWMLTKSGVSSLCARSISELSPSGLSVLFDRDRNFHAHWESMNSRFVSTWYRRAQDPKPSLPYDSRDEKFVASEWKDMHRGLFFAGHSFMKSFWVNLPLSAIKAENKLFQLRLAKEIGLNVPETLVSNNANEIRRFVSKHSPVIVKTFDSHTWSTEKNQAIFGTSVSILTDTIEFSDEALMICPAIYQRLVEKVCDIRVTIIGNKLFPAKLVSSKGGALLDWRPSTFTSDLVYQATELPAALEQKLLLLQERLGLVFGCVDLAVDREGNYSFFEVNQGGQFLFVEELLPGLPLLRAFCAMLAQGRPDYTMSSMPDLGYADYQVSDEYLGLAAKKRAEAQAFLATLNPGQEPSEVI